MAMFLVTKWSVRSLPNTSQSQPPLKLFLPQKKQNLSTPASSTSVRFRIKWLIPSVGFGQTANDRGAWELIKLKFHAAQIGLENAVDERGAKSRRARFASRTVPCLFSAIRRGGSQGQTAAVVLRINGTTLFGLALKGSRDREQEWTRAALRENWGVSGCQLRTLHHKLATLQTGLASCINNTADALSCN